MAQVQLANGLSVHYEQVGDGPDLAMIHGIAGHLATWHFKIVPSLWDRFRFLTYDLRGHGYTDLTETGYTPTELAGDLKLLLDELNIEKTDVLGHSFGADIALYFAFLYPERVRTVILIEPLVPAVTRILTKRDFRHIGWFSKALTKLGVPIPKERRLDAEYMVRRLIDVPNKWGPLKDMPKTEGTKTWLTNLCLGTSVLKDAVDVGELTLEAIPTIQAPVYLIYDSASLMWHKSHVYLEENLPNVTSVILNTGSDDLSHLSPLEAPDLIIENILRALAPAEAIRR